jgi:hypothetical protein
MRIWVDADACPNVVKEILFRAAERTRVEVTFVSNQALRIPASRYVRTIQVERGFDVADDQIAGLLAGGDLVVTADIPLAAIVVEKGGRALNPRGELYTPENIRERLAMRNLMDELRSTGIATGGPSALGKRERQAFANQLDRLLAGRDRDGRGN